MKAPSKSPVESLRRRLLERSLDATLAAIDALAALPDDALTPLFDGVATAAPASDERDGLPSLTRSVYFTGKNGPEQAWLDHALLRLAPRVADRVAAAKALCASTQLHVSGGTLRPGVSLPLDFLSSYTALTELSLSTMRPQRLDALASLTKLRAVTLIACAVDAVPELRACASIETLTLRRCGGPLPALGDWPTLRKLVALDDAPAIASDGLAGLSGLLELRLSGLSNVLFAGLGIPRSVTALSLTGMGFAHGLDGVAKLTALRALDVSSSLVHSLEPLRGHPSLTELNLSRCYAATDLAPIASIATLRALDLTNVPVTDLTPLRGLPIETLDLTSTSVRSMAPLRELAALRSLALSTHNGFTDFSPLADCAALETLRVERSPNPFLSQGPNETAVTRDLGWMARLTKLREVVVDMPALSDLRGIENCAALSSLTIKGAKALSDLTPLASRPSLTRLALAGADVRDVEALASLPSLVSVDLRFNSSLGDASPLWKIPTIRRVALCETAVPRESIPKEHRHAVTWARSPDMDRAFAPDEPQKPRVVLGPKGQGAAVRKQFSAVRAQLNTKDLDLIEQGAELLAALDDPTLFDEMIAGATWTDATNASRPNGHGGFTPPPALGTTKHANAFQTAAILAVISRAPDGSTAARALRDGVRSLYLGASNRWGNAGPVDLGALAKLPNLSRLWVSRPTTLRHVEALRGLATLTTLELGFVNEALAIDLTDCAALQSLTIEYSPKLKGLDLTGCAALRRVTFDHLPSGLAISGTKGLASLRRVELTGAASPNLLARLSTRASIEHLAVTTSSLNGLAGPLSECVSLKSLSLDGCADDLDLTVVTHAPQLARLTLRACRGITSLEPLTRLQRLAELKIQHMTVNVPDALAAAVKK